MTKKMARDVVVWKMNRSGMKHNKIAKILGISVSTVRRDIEKFCNPKTKKPKEIPRHELQLRKKIVKKLHQHRGTSTRNLAARLREEGVQVSNMKIYRVGKQSKLKFKKIRKTFRVTKVNKKKRLVYAKAHLHDDLTQYVFLDESSIQVTSPPNPRNDGEWLFEDEEPDPAPQDSHPLKCSVFVVVSLLGKSSLYHYEGKMNSPFFTSLLGKALNELRNGPYKNRKFIVVMDSATIHTAKHTVKWLKDNGVEFIPREHWPASSPDLNPIENMWSTLQQRINTKSPRTLIGLKRVATRIWDSMTKTEVSKYINSLHSRYQEVIALKGGQTKH